jgi:hypothetical protein
MRGPRHTLEEQLVREFASLSSALQRQMRESPRFWESRSLGAAGMCVELEEVRRVWADLRRSPDFVCDSDQMMTSQWTLRDLTSHVASWAREFRLEAEISLRGEEVLYEIYFDTRLGPTEWNHARVAERREQKLDDILCEIDAETCRMQDLILRAPSERLIAEAKFGPVVGPERRAMYHTLAELAAGRCVHDRYHLTRIAARCEQLHHGS